MAVQTGLTNVNPRLSSALNRKQNNDAIRIGHIVMPHAVLPAETVEIQQSAAETDLVLEDIRAASAEAKEVIYGDGSTTTVSVVERMLKVKADEREIQEWQAKYAAMGPNADTAFVPQKLAKLRRDILDAEEYRIATAALLPGNYDADHKANTLDPSATGVLTRVQNAMDTVFETCGRQVRVWALSRSHFRSLQLNADIKARYTAPAGQIPSISIPMLQDYFGIERIVVGLASRLIAGTATRFWTDGFSLMSVSDFDMSPDAFIVDDQTYGASLVKRYVDPQTAEDGADFFGVRQDGPKGVEHLFELAVGKKYRQQILNADAAFLWYT